MSETAKMLGDEILKAVQEAEDEDNQALLEELKVVILGKANHRDESKAKVKISGKTGESKTGVTTLDKATHSGEPKAKVTILDKETHSSEPKAKRAKFSEVDDSDDNKYIYAIIRASDNAVIYVGQGSFSEVEPRDLYTLIAAANNRIANRDKPQYIEVKRLMDNGGGVRIIMPERFKSLSQADANNVEAALIDATWCFPGTNDRQNKNGYGGTYDGDHYRLSPENRNLLQQKALPVLQAELDKDNSEPITLLNFKPYKNEDRVKKRIVNTGKSLHVRKCLHCEKEIVRGNYCLTVKCVSDRKLIALQKEATNAGLPVPMVLPEEPKKKCLNCGNDATKGNYCQTIKCAADREKKAQENAGQ